MKGPPPHYPPLFSRLLGNKKARPCEERELVFGTRCGKNVLLMKDVVECTPYEGTSPTFLFPYFFVLFSLVNFISSTFDFNFDSDSEKAATKITHTYTAVPLANTEKKPEVAENEGIIKNGFTPPSSKVTVACYKQSIHHHAVTRDLQTFGPKTRHMSPRVKNRAPILTHKPRHVAKLTNVGLDLRQRPPTTLVNGGFWRDLVHADVVHGEHQRGFLQGMQSKRNRTTSEAFIQILGTAAILKMRKSQTVLGIRHSRHSHRSKLRGVCTSQHGCCAIHGPSERISYI